MLPKDAPFLLFEDARADGGDARLFARPLEIVAASRLEDVQSALECVRDGLRRGLHAAGWLSYEAGLAFEPRLAAHAGRRWGGAPLLWFGLFEQAHPIARSDVAKLLPEAAGAWISSPRPRIAKSDYDDAFARVQHYLRAGDTYQINLSYRADLDIVGDPLAAYAQLRESGAGGWSAVVQHDDVWLLSTSPELFFRLKDGVIEAKPMKGTAKRGADAASDRRAAEALRSDPKESAENIMIVDLLRNDISKIATRGSVHVPAMLTVETYPTLHTLTSTVRANIQQQYDAIDVLRALFPCGSITGAPKLRAMEIIAELEGDARSAYTGSIGWISPDGAAEFNVAIRTIAMVAGQAELGLGSAVVIDSTAAGEWEECSTKGAFVTANAPTFELIETMRYDLTDGVRRLALHLERLVDSARAFGFAFDEEAVHCALDGALRGAGESRVRLALNKRGEASVTLAPIPALPEIGFDVALAPLPVSPLDFRLRHKTTLRDFYDRARAEAGADEVLFFDPDGFLTEGSFTNLFVPRAGVLLTPPLTRGLLSGVLRTELLRSGEAEEADLTARDLEGDFFVGNSLRGLVSARVKPAVMAKAV